MTEIDHNPRYPSSKLAQNVHDVMMVSSFAVWAALIGFMPVMTYHWLAA